jgi:GYF domain 2
MASRQWFIGRNGKQEGPYADERLRELIAGSIVTAETLVWCQGMNTWAKASEIPGLMSGAPRPPAAAPGSVPATGQGTWNGTGALSTNVRVWPLLGRTIVVLIAQLTIIPAPWVLPSFYRWFVDRIELPGGQRMTFHGKPGDIWYIFILNALLGYVGYIHNALQLLVLPLSLFFLLIILRWFLQNLAWEGQATTLTFTGGYWRMLGWYLLLIVSIITIIGWAWVYAAWIRWMCRHVEGSNRQLAFTAGGWSLLWRFIVFFLSCLVIIPIPWSLHWITRWFVSQLALVERA